MGKLLIKFKGDWADEMDVYGFTIISEEKWAFKKLEWEHTPFPQECMVGTNEYVEYKDMQEYLKNFKVKEISEDEIKCIQKFFGNRDFGHVCWIEGEAPDSFWEEHGHCPD